MHKAFRWCLCVCAVTAVLCAVNVPYANIQGDESIHSSEWELVWMDDFSREELDATKWTRCVRGEADWQNTMSDDPRLLKIEDGVLHLLGIVNDDTGSDPSPYLTAGITGRGKFEFQYGKVRIRARLQGAQGAWPALWMLGAEGGWPGCGEIDLMERLNFDDMVHQTVHSEYTLHIDKTNRPRKTRTTRINPDEWNIYGCIWDAGKIVFTINDEPTFTYPRVPEKGEKQWPFDRPFFFKFSMQIGGDWVNRAGPTNPGHYPAGMEVDWVRVYQRKPSGT